MTSSKQTPKSNIASVEVVKFDVASMHSKPQVAAHKRMVDDGSGQVDVFRVENNGLVPIPAEQRGKSYGGDCYIVFYTYMVGQSQTILSISGKGDTRPFRAGDQEKANFVKPDFFTRYQSDVAKDGYTGDFIPGIFVLIFETFL